MAPNQEPTSREIAAWIDAVKLGRCPMQAPAHLSRVLYLPSHNGTTHHLPLYEAGPLYHRAIGSTLLNSSLYTAKLCSMERPRADGMNAQVAWLVDFFRVVEGWDTDADGGVEINVQRREMMGWKGVNLSVTAMSSPAHSCSIRVYDPTRSQTSYLSMTSSFPIEPSQRGDVKIPHPYFTLKGFRSSILQGQIRPIENGLLRYTLVDLGDPNLTTRVRAIYHHVGLGPSLSIGYSEGVLLLPEHEEVMGLEGVVVASVLWLLGQLRMLGSQKKKKRSPSARLLRNALLRLGRHVL